jgi:DNA-directed RNA polymerase
MIEQECPNIRLLMKYLDQMSILMTDLGLPIVWRLPSGLTVRQKYMNIKEKKITPYTFKKSTITLSIVDDVKINKKKQRNALMPNLIHSLDAASLTLLFDTFYRTVRYHNNNVNFYSVHDCYGVTAPNVRVLIEQLRSVYIKLYSKEGYILNFEQDIILAIKKAYSKAEYNEEKRSFIIEDKEYSLPKFPYKLDDDKRIEFYKKLRTGLLFIG